MSAPSIAADPRAAIAIVMALIAREQDGLGQRLEVPLFDAMFLAFGASGLLVNGAAAGGRPADPWSGTYQCRDGAMVLLNLATPRFVWRFLEATGTLPQNVSFAVKASVILSFLEAHGVAASEAGAEAALAVADVAERARASTVRVECLQ